MTREEVLEKLEAMGLSISRETLRRWVNEGLVPEPERGNKGRAGGRWTEYPVETPWEAFASGSLLRDNSVRQVAEIRREAQQIIADVCSGEMEELLEEFEKWQEENAIIYDEEGDGEFRYIKELPGVEGFPGNEKVIRIDHLVFAWMMGRIKAEYDVPLQVPITVYINYSGTWAQKELTSIEITDYVTFSNTEDWGRLGIAIVNWRINRVEQHTNLSENDEIVIKDTEKGVIIRLRDRRSRMVKTGV